MQAESSLLTCVFITCVAKDPRLLGTLLEKKHSSD